MLEPVDINLELKNQKVKFEGIIKGKENQPVSFDYVPPIGDGDGYLGLEMLVMSFAGCVSTAIVGILRRMEKAISGYRMHILGIKHETPLYLEEIRFDITIRSDNITEENLKAVISRAEEISPVWIAIKNNVAVSYTFSIIRSED